MLNIYMLNFLWFFFCMYFFLPAAELHVTEQLMIYVCYPKREEHLQIL